MASCPIVRERVLDALSGRGAVKAVSLSDLKNKLGLVDISVTQFAKALGSLCYNHSKIVWARFIPEGEVAGIDGCYSRSHVVTTK